MSPAALASVESIGRPGAGIDRFKYERLLGQVPRAQLPARARHLLFALLRRVDASTCILPAPFTPSLQMLADDAGLSLSTARRGLVDAERAGWLHVARGRGRGRRSAYVLTVPEKVSTRPLRSVPDPVDNPVQQAVKGVTVATVKGVTVTAPSYKENHTKKDHHRTDPDPGGAAGMMTMIISEMELATGRVLTGAQARHISNVILGRAPADPVNPAEYVRGSIRRNPSEFVPPADAAPVAALPARFTDMHRRCGGYHTPDRCPLEGPEAGR